MGVVGAGPTGIAAARDLAKLGYGVTLYEALPVVGGMLTAGIPEWRLPRDLCKRELDEYLTALGVEIRVNTPIGFGTTKESTPRTLIFYLIPAYLAAAAIWFSLAVFIPQLRVLP